MGSPGVFVWRFLFLRLWGDSVYKKSVGRDDPGAPFLGGGGFRQKKQLNVKESPSHGCAVPAPFGKGAFGAGLGPSSTPKAPLVKGGRAAG